MKKLNMQQAAQGICDAIRSEYDAVENFVHDVELFLSELPQDLGKGSLNGMKGQLQQKCRDYLSS